MSTSEKENLLSQVTPGPMFVNDRYRDEDSGDYHVCTGNPPHGDFFVVETPDKADAALFALAHDHALLLAAIATRNAKLDRLVFRNVFTQAESSNICVRLGRVKYSTDLDSFGCPALTPDLRAALRRALKLDDESEE